MSRIAMLLLLPLVTAASPAERRPEPTRCGKPGADAVRSTPDAPTRVRPLNEMPDARPTLSVWRQVDGCSVLLVRENGRIVEEPVGRPERRRVFRP